MGQASPSNQGAGAVTAQSRTSEPASGEALARALATLRPRFGERLTENLTVRQQHANTLSEIPVQSPDAVVFPNTTADVVAIGGVCSEHRVPLVPFGAGTSLEGQVNALSAACASTFRG